MSIVSAGLPESLVEAYDSCGIRNLFPWQLECLAVPGVSEGKNLVFSAPTSAGKTLVAEILAIKRVITTGLKCLFILPFVSLAREKMLHLQRVCSPLGLRVEGFMGSLSGMEGWEIAVCTTEKANGLINRFIEQQVIHTVGVVVVDELHSVGDYSRGYLLELLLTKLRYISNKQNGNDQRFSGIQLIGMSATLPNLELLAHWLDAKLYITNFRPVTLVEMIKVNVDLFDKQMLKIRSVSNFPFVTGDSDNVISLCLETILTRKGVLIFCSSKNGCEKLAENIAKQLHTIITGKETSVAQKLKEIYKEKEEDFRAFMADYKRISVVIDPMLARTLPYGVAFHHAGLTMEEREQIERGFKKGLLTILVATSTLSSGVNLPAERVIIRSLWGSTGASAMGPTLNVATYKQMSGRAGRMGLDETGESIIICKPTEVRRAVELITGELSSISSCLWVSDDLEVNSVTSAMKRAVLEIIASGLVTSCTDALEYMRFTILSAETSVAKPIHETESLVERLIKNCIKYLSDNEFVRLYDDDQLSSTQLGCAALASSLGPDEALAVFSDLQEARKAFCLENELQMVYLVTPVYASQSWRSELDWNRFYRIWSQLPNDLRRAAELLGVKETFLIKAAANGLSTTTKGRFSRANEIHLRFVSALALFDLISEVPLAEVTEKFGCNRGFLQALQQQSSTYAGMVVSFCDRLGWWSLKALLAGMAERLAFGIRRELTELVTIDGIDGTRAKAFHQAGLSTISRLAVATKEEIIAVLRKAVPFESSLKGYRESEWEVSERLKRGQRHGWLSGHPDLTESEAAEIIRRQARQLLGGNLEKLGVNVSDSFFNTKTEGNHEDKTDIRILGSVKSQGPSHDLTELQIVPKKVESTPLRDNTSLVSSTPVNELLGDNSNLTISRRTESELSKRVEYEVQKAPAPVTKLMKKTHKLSMSPIRTERRSTKKDIPSPLAAPKKSAQTDSPLVADVSLTASQWQQFLDSESDIVPNVDENPNKLTEFLNKSNGNIEEILSESFCNALNLSCFEEKIEEEVFLENDAEKHQEGKEDVKPHTLPTSSCDSSCPSEKEELEDSLADFYPMLDSQLARETAASRASKRSSFKTSQSPSPVQRKKTKSPADLGCSHTTTDSFTLDLLADEILNQATTSGLNFSLDSVKNRNMIDDEKIADQMLSERSTRPSILSIVNEDQNYQDLISRLQNSINPLSISYVADSHSEVRFRGVAICWNPTSIFYVNFDQLLTEGNIVKDLLHNYRGCQIMFDAKKTCAYSLEAFLDGKIRFRCCQIAAWMLHSDRSSRSLKAFVLEFIPNAWKVFEELKFDRSDSSAKQQCCFEAVFSYLLYPVLEKLLEKEGLLENYLSIELPFVRIVCSIELRGIGFDSTEAVSLRKNLQTELDKITELAHKAAGRKFSISSPTDCAKVLYSELKLSPDGDPTKVTLSSSRTTTRHYSTSAEVMKKLSHLHPLPGLIMRWRNVHHSLHSALDCFIKAKLFSTRVGMERICGTYDCLTATGRAIMQDPSLQTMAKSAFVFSKEGEIVSAERQGPSGLRSLFIPTKGSLMLAADYSQLELRILAHLSQDVKLLSILNSEGGDVFKMVAASLAKVPEEDVTDTLRQQAKQICYGIIYGMGPKNLSILLNSDLVTAESFLLRFKSEFPGVNKWILDTINSSHQSGQVRTITGRIRRLEIGLAVKGFAGRKRYDRGHVERQAVNTCVQGSASDLFKSAVSRIESAGLASSVVLLMHDEVILEVPEMSIQPVAGIVRNQMESAMQLSVKLPVKLKVGPTWGDLADYS